MCDAIYGSQGALARDLSRDRSEQSTDRAGKESIHRSLRLIYWIELISDSFSCWAAHQSLYTDIGQFCIADAILSLEKYKNSSIINHYMWLYI
jgi:hypothetical protein